MSCSAIRSQRLLYRANPLGYLCLSKPDLSVLVWFFCRREPTPPEVRAAREREKELAELDRDIRTVFAYNLNLKAEEKDLFQFFSTAGKVLDVRIISDRNTRRSKGFAYIEYARRVSIPDWLMLPVAVICLPVLCLHMYL